MARDGAAAARGNASGVPLAAARQSVRSGHAPQRGARGVQTSAPSSMRAWLKSPGFRAGTSGRARRANPRERRRRLRVEPERAEAAEDAHDVAVHDGLGDAERDRGDRGGRVRADAGQRAPALERARKRARRGDGLRGAVEVAGARVVPEAAPLGEDVALLRPGERLDGRKARAEAFPAGHDDVERRLLRHDLGEPDRVRVARRAPGQVAPRAPVPAREAARHVARVVEHGRESRLGAWRSTGRA